MNKATQRSDHPGHGGETRYFHGAFALFALSFALPAVMINGEALWGLQAAILSVLGLGTLQEPESLRPGETPACAIGFVSNTMAVTGYLAFVWQAHVQKRETLTRVPSIIVGLGALAAFLCGALLQAYADHWILLPGYFLWTLGAVLMALALWHLRMTQLAIAQQNQERKAEQK